MLKVRSSLALVGVLVATIALSACATTETNTTMSGGMMDTPSSTPSVSVGNTGAFNDADVAFAMGMIPHHKQAIDMADTILGKSGIDPKVTDLATRIKAAQDPEITEMTAWLTTWGSPMDSMSGMSGMDSGMMSDSEMAALDASSGTDAAKLFLTQMTTHHQGAISMAKTEINQGKNPDAINLASSIVTSQSAEITEMATILSTLM
ncbi:DUF305 domain-containing protein [Subtercola frigoramans]